MDRGVFRQYVAAFIGSLSVRYAGSSYGWVTPLLASFHDPLGHLPMTHDQSSWVVALIEFGNLFTSIPSGLMVNRYGRKPLLIGTAPVYIISWILTLTTRSVSVLYFVRTIQGLAMGVIYTILPMYLAEISDPRIRGAICTFFEGMWYLGILSSYIVGSYLSYFYFNLVTMTIPLIFLVTFSWIPESPYFLIMTNQEEKAILSLKWLRASNKIHDELNQMKKSLKEERDIDRSWKDIFSTNADIRAFFVVEIVVITKFMSGIAAIVSYASEMFASSGDLSFTADHYTILMGVILLFSTVFAGALVDKAGRRPLLLISCVGCAISEFFAGLFCFLESHSSVDISEYRWIFKISIMTYCTIFSLGLGPLVNTLKGEIFPASTKGLGSGLTTMTDTISCFICLKMYQHITDTYGVFLNFWIFSAFSIFGAIITYYVVPETKGKTFSEIHQILSTPRHPTVVQYDSSTVNENMLTVHESAG